MRIIAQRDGNCGVLNKSFDGLRGQKIEVFMRDGECIVLIDGEEFEVCEGLPLEIVVSSDPVAQINEDTQA